MPVITMRTLDADDWAEWRVMRLDALREAQYAFSSKLADWEGEGDTERRWRERLEAVPFNVIAILRGGAAGQVSATARRADGSVMLVSMWVMPSARGRGVGDALVHAVIEWAREQSASHVVLDVVPTNAHAIALYERHSFIRTGHTNESDESEMTRST
jgi:ribosomal protein S18 acetylase RimI-like enzyme